MQRYATRRSRHARRTAGGAPPCAAAPPPSRQVCCESEMPMVKIPRKIARGAQAQWSILVSKLFIHPHPTCVGLLSSPHPTPHHSIWPFDQTARPGIIHTSIVTITVTSPDHNTTQYGQSTKELGPVSSTSLWSPHATQLHSIWSSDQRARPPGIWRQRQRGARH